MMTRRFLIFLSVVALLTFYTAGKAAALMPGRESLAWTLAVLFCLVPALWQIAYRFGIPAEDSVLGTFVAWGVTLMMGVGATFLLFSLACDAGASVWALLARFATTPAAQPILADVSTRWLPAILFTASAAIAVIGMGQAVAGPRVKVIAIPIKNLPRELEGLKIAQISDLHVGPTIRRGYVESVVARVLELKPDLIAVTGDLVDGSVEKLSPQLRALERLKAPLGVYYVTGNHEYYWGAETWVRKAAALGMVPLINENRVVDVAGVKILVAGVTDTSGGHFLPSHASDPVKAAASGTATRFKLLLAHRPDSCEEAEPVGFDLQVSGHTHGGQFFPFSLLIPLFHRYYRGLNRHGKLWVYVSTGTGYWGPPDRFLVPSEITLLRLSGAAA